MNTMNAVSTDVTMDFEDFVSEVKRRLQERYTDCEVKAARVDKNNGLCLMGITIMPPDRRVVPNIYLDSFYEDYREGRSVDSVISGIIGLYEANMTEKDIALPDIRDFGAVKDIICCRLVNRVRNLERLEGIPHRPFLDLAVVYYLPVSVNTRYDGSITVTDKMAALWRVDEADLYRYAIGNIQRLFRVRLQALEELIREKAPDWDGDGPIVPLYVLRCESPGGAAAMLFGHLLREFAKDHGDFYILPSSTHEVLLHPVIRPHTKEDDRSMCRMVQSVNWKELEPDEILSDNAYLYHAGTDTIEVLG